VLKFLNTEIVFREIPDEISLAINLTNCPLRCQGCHSPWLREDIGKELTDEILLELIKQSSGITCVLFLGGDSSYEDIRRFAKIIKNTGLKVAWYSGQTIIHTSDLEFFDYIKIGPYEKKLGGLDKITTNQRLFKVINSKYDLQDITFKFQQHLYQ